MRHIKTQVVRANQPGPQREYKTSDYRWQKLAAEFKQWHKPRRTSCWLCGEPIDYQLTTGPWCFETDHRHPRITHPHLMFDWSNLRPSHRRCNRARQARPVDDDGIAQTDTSVWVKPDW